MFRTDEHTNPTAFTTDIAKEAGLVEGVDYEQGTPFLAPGSTSDSARMFYTAKLLGDPIMLTIRVIDAIGFYTKGGAQRWSYIAMPHFVWNELDLEQKRDVIGFMYQREGGTEMRNLFPNYGAL